MPKGVLQWAARWPSISWGTLNLAADTVVTYQVDMTTLANAECCNLQTDQVGVMALEWHGRRERLFLVLDPNE